MDESTAPPPPPQPPLSQPPSQPGTAVTVATPASSAPLPPPAPPPPPGPLTGHYATDLPPPSKRQRVSQACGPCRDRKTRCDGQQPVCRACEGRGVANRCNYDYARRQRQSRGGSGSGSADALTSPAIGGLNLSSSDRDVLFRADSERRRKAAQALSDLGGHHAAAALSLNDNSGPRNYTSMPADWPAGVRADGLGGDASLFGPSSTSTVATENYTPDRRITKAEGLAVLPRRRQADSFLLCYWEFIHPLFPVLHRPSFLRKYERLWTGEENLDTCKGVEDATFNATLNLVFAIGCNFTTWIGPSLKAFVAEDFFQRARSSYHFDILDSNSISTVQMLVLTAIYLQSTQYASRCWNTLGLAVRMAQGLGLHVDAHGRRLMSNVEEQMRRRIWHTCVHLDRLTATTFGRPSMIRPVVDVPLPDILDDEQLADGNLGAQPEKPSRLGLFVYSSRLFELMGEILDRFYRHGAPKRDAADIVTSALEFNRRLDDFAANLPEHLRVLGQNEPASPPTEDYVQLQRQVLNCRFLYVRLQSLRPLLEIATERDPKPFSDPSLDDDVVQDCCNRCISTACQLVGAIHDNIGTLYRSSGWHSVYLTFAAAVTLLASYKATKQLRLPNDDRETAWVRSLAILEHYESQIPSAAHAMGILKSIKAQILPASSGVAPAPSTNESSQLDPALRAASDLLPDHDGAAETAVMEAAAPVDLHARISVEDSQVFNAMNISEAWYGQQLLDLDWLEIPPPTWQ